MKKILVIVMLIFAFGCSDDATEPSENSIVGKWKMEYIGEIGKEYDDLVLEIDKNGKFITFLKNHRGKIEDLEHNYTYSTNVFTISSLECEGEEGKYTVEFRDNGFELKLINDDCSYRNLLFTGFYEKYVEPLP